MKWFKRYVWTRREGIKLTRLLNEAALPHGYCVTFGGSVLLNGGSYKDLDVVCIPLLSIGTNHRNAFQAICEALAPVRTIHLVNRVDTSQKTVYSIKLEDGRRVDVFFPSVPLWMTLTSNKYPLFNGRDFKR